MTDLETTVAAPAATGGYEAAPSAAPDAGSYEPASGESGAWASGLDFDGTVDANAPDAPLGPPPDPVQDWEQRFKGLQGKSQQTVEHLQKQIDELVAEKRQQQQQAQEWQWRQQQQQLTPAEHRFQQEYDTHKASIEQRGYALWQRKVALDAQRGMLTDATYSAKVEAIQEAADALLAKQQGLDAWAGGQVAQFRAQRREREILRQAQLKEQGFQEQAKGIYQQLLPLQKRHIVNQIAQHYGSSERGNVRFDKRDVESMLKARTASGMWERADEIVRHAQRAEVDQRRATAQAEKAKPLPPARGGGSPGGLQAELKRISDDSNLSDLEKMANRLRAKQRAGGGYTQVTRQRAPH